jgi:hypothetical protein
MRGRIEGFQKVIAGLLVLGSVALLLDGAQAEPPEVRLSRAERRSFDTFFSNFAETNLEPFSRGKLSDKALILFCLQHHLRNFSRRIETNKDGTEARLAARYVDETAMQYFGRRPKVHASPDKESPYRNGYYYNMNVAAGDAIPFAQIVMVKALGNREYQADVNIYLPPGGTWDGDEHAPPSSWKDFEGMGMPKRTGQVRAIIRKVTSGGATRYILIEYRKAGA